MKTKPQRKNGGNGWENLGKMMQFVTKNAKEFGVTTNDMALYSHLCNYSIGYRESSVECAYTDVEHFFSRPTFIKAKNHLVELDLIKRIPGDFGPKKAYRYQIVFKSGVNIDTKAASEYKADESSKKMLTEAQWKEVPGNVINSDYDKAREDYKTYKKDFE